MPIPQTFDEAFARIRELVNTFKENEAFYTGSAYQEAEARKDFIDKFWIALGWDINSEEETDPYKQRAKVERAVATSEFRKRADYAFYSSNFRDVQFFVEAKKPRVGLDTPLYYFQTIRYGWNSHVPISVLHDFEEMRVLDCRYKPDINTALGHAVLKYHYTDYANEQSFRTIYYLFSRQKVDDGSIQEYAKGLPKISRKRAARGVATDEHQSIDESFLQELDVFREELARGYKRKNPELDSAALTEVTQRTLDRLVFMRFLEDKLIESDQLIEDLHRKGKSWDNFIATSRRLDRVYNGIIFKEHSLLDGPKFKADERVFDKISRSLSHRESPYDFNAIPIHILGSIYERFLGKVIVATAKLARVEDKPEVRKAGGVYYTPEYIVRYIVENTVGKLIEGKTPAQIQEMRFADIACGSGSFLLGVYDTLLRYHTAYFNRTKKIREMALKARICIPKEDGTLQLSLLQKRQILLNNIYGVDIDTQAVEVAQLSLYLKLLEDETIASAKAHQRALHAALLPSLSKNIVCGNSLIGWDILEGKLFDSGEERNLNPMNFEDAFPEVMKRGGFDAIVGNPPYIRMEVFKDIKNYLKANYESHDERSDLYAYFIERGNELIKPRGRYGVIVSNKFLRANYGAPLRDLLKQKTRVHRIVDFAGLPVFKGATVRTVILLTSRDGGADKSLVYSPPIPPAIFATVEAGLLSVEIAITGLEYEVDSASLSQPVWNFMKRDRDDLFGKLKARGLRLGDYCNGQICMGVKSGLTEAFV
ncbi:MAG: N-6 DNA methylase, partial [Pyrinomonadaceae bacterium]